MKSPHSFHIPVMGLGFTIDTPIKVAKYGISSVVSIMEDHLIEDMRKAISLKYNKTFTQIPLTEEDYRAKRVTAYLDLLDEIVNIQIEKIKNEDLVENSEIEKYFNLLSYNHPFNVLYNKYKNTLNLQEKNEIGVLLKSLVIPGAIDVNIMCKADRDSYDGEGNVLSSYYSNATASLRGYVNSKVKGSVVLSAGFNPRLYNYIGDLKEFKPSAHGQPLKTITLKVSDFRSAQIQGKYLAKKGVLINEFRIESGLNCGGHAFPTDGTLLGPVLEEFKTKLPVLENELIQLCNQALEQQGNMLYSNSSIKLSAQGGVGTSQEHDLLLSEYNLSSVGWGSPFLMVPEATNVDEETLSAMVNAKKEDYYLSNNSPLGVMINNFKNSSALTQLKNRILNNKPGSPCTKKFLAFNTEFTKEPICVASRQYQDLKIKQIKETISNVEEQLNKIEEITQKECLCEGLGISALKINHVHNPKRPQGVSICPGPNLAYFSGTFSLAEMVGHIYGKISILNNYNREHMFVNELNLYIDYIKKEVSQLKKSFDVAKSKNIDKVILNLNESINYYKSKFELQLTEAEEKLKSIIVADTVLV